MTNIPIIDLCTLNEPDLSRQIRIAKELRDALRQSGFFIITNHGISQKLINQTFSEAKKFHDQPMSAKQAVLMNEHNNGYMAMNRYKITTSRASEDGAKPDLNEAFFIKRERSSDDPLVQQGRRFAGPNEWPKGLPGFKDNVLKYTKAIDEMAQKLLAPLAISLDMPANTFKEAFCESQFSFRLSHYPKVSELASNQYGIAPHTDSNFLTFLAQTSIPGLQIQTKTGQWLNVPYVPQSFVVNSGDMLHRWTNGFYKSTPHRALPPTKDVRYAIPFFFGPHLDTTIECLPSCQSSDNPPQFPPISYNDYISWWYDKNYNAKVQDDLAKNT
jgi:isopenicillin N synthase-like dioxygenase